MTLASIPIDISRLSMWLCVSAPEPRADFTTGEAKIDRESGKPEFVVGVLVKPVGDRKGYVLDVRVPGEPVGLVEGEPVVITGFTGAPWQQGERSGVSYRAESITPAKLATPPASVSGVSGAASRAAGKGGDGS